ncbi:hypothetical protein BH11MYX4_BH11MYX4_31010 [soil metagenome]
MSRANGLVFLTVVLGAAALGVAACSDDGNLAGTSSGSTSGGASGTSGGGTSGGGTSGGTSGTSGTSGGAPKATEEVSGDISASRTLPATKDYLLKGLVRVKPGATLTIEKGTTIKGDSATKAILLVEAGGKLVAEGTADEPIVFTSQAAAGVRRAGDWGGVVLLGNAPVNVPGGKGNIEGILTTASGTQYGGTDADDSSGVLRYIRIEYAGTVLSPDNEVNGLTFGGVGRGTKVDHIQVRQALDDCFEWFGGTVDAHHLICQYNQDDGFDTDNGYSGRLQFLVLQQDPAHAGEDNGFESDNDAQGSGNLPLTNPTVFNATMCGKNADPAGAQFGALIRRNARGSYNNVLFQGFEANLDVRDPSTAIGITGPGAGEPALTLKAILFGKTVGTGVQQNVGYLETGAAAPDKDNDGAFDEIAWVKTAANANLFTDPAGLDCFNPSAPKFGPTASLTTGAITPPNDGFFDATATYIGAFKDANDNWATTGKWAVWDAK